MSNESKLGADSIEAIIRMFIAAGATVLLEEFAFTPADNVRWAEMMMSRFAGYFKGDGTENDVPIEPE